MASLRKFSMSGLFFGFISLSFGDGDAHPLDGSIDLSYRSVDHRLCIQLGTLAAVRINSLALPRINIRNTSCCVCQ
jgi:hypothetical protein